MNQPHPSEIASGSVITLRPVWLSLKIVPCNTQVLSGASSAVQSPLGLHPKKKILCHVPWEANEDISLVKYGHQPKELEVLGMLWGREAWIDQVPDVPRLVDVYVLIYEVKDWLQMSPTNLETWSKPLVNA